ncbi:hypothetical protein CAEBREN_31763 [Caenorhabditis brenneri]|uniref:Uncharacterized protein n=1 Tax=Caenorhabditis brenneri TaxID=135651 RepID=G0PJ46_CAEBE|nr:hypothetical protein CAEBREN_31763 [Caenorhabditis brenneri]
MVMYLSVMVYNLHLNSQLTKDTARRRLKKFDKYSLAYRFQLEENLKVFQLVKKVIISIGIYVLLNIFCVFLINSNNLSASFNISLVFLVENCININPLLICTVTINSVPPWKQTCLQDIDKVLVFIGLRRGGRKVHHDKKAPLREGSGIIGGNLGARVESDIYFRDLKSMWA